MLGGTKVQSRLAVGLHVDDRWCVDRLRRRFGIGRVCVVADRGMISAQTLAALEARGLEYVLGVRERSAKEVRTLVLGDDAPFVPLVIPRQGRPDTELEAKATTFDGRRYIVCRNRAEAEKDAADREAIVANLRRALRHGDKALVGNRGYRRFLKAPEVGFAIDEARIAEDARFDGIFVLRTNTTLDPLSKDYKWVDEGVVIASRPGDDYNTIDPNVVQAADGTLWLAFGSYWSGIKLISLDPQTGKALPNGQMHALARRSPPGAVEAAFITQRDGYYYLFVSWGLCCRGPNSTYHVVVGRARDVKGPYLDRQGKDMAQGGGSLVIQGYKDWRALGHNSAYTFDGKDYLVLHAYETADHYKQKLKVMDIHLDKDGWPTVDPKDLNKYVSEELE